MRFFDMPPRYGRGSERLAMAGKKLAHKGPPNFDDRSTKPAKNYFVTVVQEKEGVSKTEKERGCCVSAVNGAATSNSIGSDPTSNLPLRRARFENGSSH